MSKISWWACGLLFVALGACSDAAEPAPTAPETGDDDELIKKPSCPASGAAGIAALKAVAAQAEACAAAPPATPDTTRDWAHTTSSIVAATGSSNHRGRDVFYAEGAEQWVLGKFAYGLTDKDLKGEEVDIYIQRGCQGPWEPLKLPTPAVTTEDGEHETVEGVEDTGGRIYAKIPAAQRLSVGHHRVRMVVAGDQTFADQTIEVLPKGTPIFVSDVDGTLTERRPDDTQAACDEESDFPALWDSMLSSGAQPFVHEGASALFQKFASLGYRPMYLTARPEWLAPHTRNFMLAKNRGDGRGDLPQGVVHTTLGATGAFNSAAEEFKKQEMKDLVAKGFKPMFGFGNRPSDVATYTSTGVPFRFYFENLDTQLRSCSKVTDVALAPAGVFKQGNWRIQSYGSLLPKTASLAPVCK